VITLNPDAEGFLTYFFEGHGSFSRHTLRIEGNTWFWEGETRRSRCVLSDDGLVLTAHHERLDGDAWVPSIEVVLRKA
jgi:hypothetical protein